MMMMMMIAYTLHLPASRIAEPLASIQRNDATPSSLLCSQYLALSIPSLFIVAAVYHLHHLLPMPNLRRNVL